ncbi:MAG: citrate lyase subunit alpha [Propionibacteriaceae bacterium]|jgi:citrate lyase subunit alpha/citrate CoA-transferase|nr:citrate lyase subunit alpha [Propionibacteriaceae bacterium]
MDKHYSKLCESLAVAIKRSGLANGGTISFHHHFREGDRVLLAVVGELARLGFRDLTLASSSLAEAHSELANYIEQGVIAKIYSSGMRGALADRISHGLMAEPVQIHSHGGRAALMETGEIHPDVAFIGVPSCDRLGNANGVSGQTRCGSLGYALVDVDYAGCVVLLTEELAPYPNHPASIRQDRVNLIVQMASVGDPSRIGVGATRVTKNPRDLLIARRAAQVLTGSGLFNEGFSVQTGSGAAAIATTRYLREQMSATQTKAAWALGGITGEMVDLYDAGLVGRLVDTQSFDLRAIDDLKTNPNHHEISAAEYANPLGLGAYVDELDMVVLSALEIDLDFNVNVLTGSDGVMRGASGGHCDTARGAKLAIVTAPLLRSRTPTVVEKVTTVITPGSDIAALVTDAGIAVNPNRPELHERLHALGLPLSPIADLLQRSIDIAGRPRSPEFGDKVVAVVRYRDGSVIDEVHEVLK